MRRLLMTIGGILMGMSMLNGQTGSFELSIEGMRWVDSIFATLTLDQKIGQLFMIPAYSNKGAAHEAEIKRLINSQQVGGIIFMQGGPGRQAQLTNRFQAASKVPLLIAQDAEWGLGMRLDSTISYPRQLTMGAIRDARYIYDFGKEVARQCKRIGVHINFAPVIDVNNNIRNPVINDRSFGENRYNVALRGLQYMKGLQENGVIACAKHFPGHGDTDKDSHKALPVILHSRARLDSIELFPFNILIKQGLLSIMTAHLFVPALESMPNRASSLSPNVVTDLLQKEMGFNGLIFTDALSMQGVAGFNQPGNAELQAFKAGNDILLFPSDMEKARELIRQAIDRGEIPMATLDKRVRKILIAKAWVGLNKYKPVQIKGIYDDLNTPQAQLVNRRIVENAITLAGNKDRLIPFTHLDTLSLNSICIGPEDNTRFQQMMDHYAPVAHYNVAMNAPVSSFDNYLKILARKEVVIVGLYNESTYHSRQFGISAQARSFLEKLNQQTKVVLVIFGNPYSLEYFKDFDNVVIAYDDEPLNEDNAAMALFGGIPVRGQLPVSVSTRYSFGTGEVYDKPIRLKYTDPEDAGILSEYLTGIERIAREAIYAKATPGCQVLVAKDGKVFYEQSFGYQTYDKSRPVRNGDLYDLASITKVAATTISLMYLYEQGKLDLNENMAKYLPDLKGSAVGTARIRDVLTHSAGLTAWIPFYLSTTKNDSIYSLCYHASEDETYCIPVAKDLFMRKDYQDSVFAAIRASSLKTPGQYKYSDLGFILFAKLIEERTGKSLDQFAGTNFYQPLGLPNMRFNPASTLSPERIVPSEEDDYYRHQVVRGYVHDMGAAMLGGVSGHAGLFSNASDMAVLFQMLLNGGSYGGKKYFEKETIDLWTKQQTNRSRRGLGFDKPEPDARKVNYTSDNTPLSTFGHTGFTGTAVWADPENDVIFVFLSNRVYPTMENKKLITESYRPRIQEVIYDAIKKSKGKLPVFEGGTP